VPRIADAQEPLSRQWEKLIDASKTEEARRLCTPWLNSPELVKQAEAHKCLANVVLRGKDNSIVRIEGNDVGGGEMHGGFKDEAIDEALKHLNEAIRLAPQDLSIHQGRLHLLEISMRHEEMAKALDESCTIYQGADALQAWLAYTAELFEAGHHRSSILLLNVLDKHFPNNHEVIGNLGAGYSALKEDDKAIEYLRKAVALAPADPIDTWNLGRLYDYTGKIQLADQWYQKALSLDTDAAQRRGMACLYAKFVETKLHDAKRACELQKASCESSEQTACKQAKPVADNTHF
jgi:tetratricopeptide (TPR) repeat protein